MLIEKPATTNSAEFRSLLELARDRGVFVMEAMWTRFQPVAHAVKRLIDEGSLGDPVAMHADFSNDFDIDSECLRCTYWLHPHH